jgi:CBS domain-containing protein
MRKTYQPLLSLRAEDLMTREVTKIPQEMSLRGAAHLLSLANVTGAPVIDAAGRCVGVLSATDFLHWAEKGYQGDGRCKVPVCVCSDWQMVEMEFIPRDPVRNYMTHDPVLVTPTTHVTELARKMLDAHIHRVIVVDAGNRPVGIVSSTDVLAAIAYADASDVEIDAEIHCEV